MSRGSARVFCDWGSSRLRAFLECDAQIIERRDGPGIGRLGGESPAEALANVLGSWRAHWKLDRVVLCGMAGSCNGVVEVPYVYGRVTFAQWCAGACRAYIGGDVLMVLAGIQAENFRDVSDVMRGEETQIFGALALEETLAVGRQVIVLPGTHSKWVELDDGHVTRLQTYLTGELFDLLTTRSSLFRVGEMTEVDEAAFDVGLRKALRYDLAGNLFETRCVQLVEGRSAGWARSLLSGLLIGAEVHSMRTHHTVRSGPFTLIGEPALTARYARALESYGVEARQLDGERCAVAGMRAAADFLQEF